MRTLLSFAAFTGVALLTTSCAARRSAITNWRLLDRGQSQLLVPPDVIDPDLQKRTLKTPVSFGKKPCPPEILRRHNNASLTVDRAELTARPNGWLAGWTSELETTGCLTAGAGQELSERIVESVPLDPRTAFRLLQSSDPTSEVDLGSNVRLQVVSPIGTSVKPEDPIVDIKANSNYSLSVDVKSSADLKGYETAWYALQPKPSAIGFDIVPLYADRTIGGSTERVSRPETIYFRFPSTAAFYRLIYKANQTDFTAIVIAAPTRPELDRRTHLLEAGPVSCATLSNDSCLEIPRRVAINPMLSVMVNAKETYITPGTDVGGAIRTAGARDPQASVSTLIVSRLYNGKPTPVDFDRSSNAILRLTLKGGESISWSGR